MAGGFAGCDWWVDGRCSCEFGLGWWVRGRIRLVWDYVRWRWEEGVKKELLMVVKTGLWGRRGRCYEGMGAGIVLSCLRYCVQSELYGCEFSDEEDGTSTGTRLLSDAATDIDS